MSTMRGIKAALASGASGAASGLLALGAAEAAGPRPIAGLDPTLALTGGAVAFALGAAVWAVRLSAASRTLTLDWSRRLATMEADLERSESVLASHPGLVIVWNDALDEIEEGWGRPRVLGSPAALASLLTFASDDPEAFLRPADALLSAFGDLPVDEDAVEPECLRDKVRGLRRHGVSFSGSVVTAEGRSIDCDGRVAGDQVTLWLTDPAVRLAEEAGVVGQARNKAADLHGALNQLDRAPLAAWRRGADTRLEWVNKAYVEMVEAVNMDQVIDEQIEIDPAFKALAERAAREIPRTGRRALDDVATVTVRGQRRVLRIVESALHGIGEGSLGGMAIDVTRQSQAKIELQRHQEAHRKTLDQLTSAVAVFGGQQQLEYYNQAFLDLWTLDDADLRARPSHGEILDRLRHAEALPAQPDWAAWKASQLRLYTEEAGEAGSAAEGAAPDEIWNLPSGRTLRVGAQRHAMGGVTVVYEDVTEALNLQSQFNEQHGVQQATLNNLAEGVAVFGADGCLALYNRAFRSMWGLEQVQLANPNRPWDEIARHLDERAPGHDEALAGIKQRIVSLESHHRVAVEGQEIRLKDGRTFAHASSPLPDGRTLLTFLDVTDAKRREEALENEKRMAEDSERLKTRFLDHISYHLRTPLTSIIGFAGLLEQEHFGELNDRQKDYIASILTASSTQIDFVNDIIDLTAIDAGKLDLDLAVVDLGGLIKKAVTYSALKAEDAEVRLKIDVAGEDLRMMGDEKRLGQVIFNLLSNAFAFTDPGGEVTLSARRDGDVLVVSVVDTGRGASPEDAARAFGRFESAGPGAGAGIGLTLVQAYVGLHGGHVQLETIEGAGTTVTCHLPVGNVPELAMAS